MQELPKIGEVISDRYRLTEKLGSGGMGAVFAAEHVLLGKLVAIKFLHPHYAAEESAVLRLQREAQAAASVGHRGVVEIHDVGWSQDGLPFLVMEFLLGENLESILDRKGRFSPPEAIEVAKQMLSALIAVHKKGIIHRDLKPANVYCVRTPEGGAQIKLLDFGVSKIQQEKVTTKLTRTGAVFGTPHYMAPESARGAKNTDHRVDIWAMGVILYEMLTGRVPYEGDTYNELLAKILTEPYPPPRSIVPGLHEDLERVILKAMARDLDQRYQRAADLLGDLLECADANIPLSLDSLPLVPEPFPSSARVEDTKPTAPEESSPTDSLPMEPEATRTEATATLTGGDGESPHASLSFRRSVFTLSVVLLILFSGLLAWAILASDDQGGGDIATDAGSPATAAIENRALLPDPQDRAVIDVARAEADGGRDPSVDNGAKSTKTAGGQKNQHEGRGALAGDAGWVPISTSQKTPSDARIEVQREVLANKALSGVHGKMQACLEQGRQPPPLLRLQVTADEAGGLDYAGASPSPPSTVVDCLTKVIRSVTLEPGVGPRVSVTLLIRRRVRPDPLDPTTSEDQSPLEANPFQ